MGVGTRLAMRMKKLSDPAKKMILTIIVLAAVFIAAGAVYYRSLAFLPFALGVVIGSAVSVVKVILLERAVERALTMDKKKAGGYVRLHHLLRLLITGAALALAALVPWIGLWGAVAGVLAFQLATYLLKFTMRA